jgi:hypothetical protein
MTCPRAATAVAEVVVAAIAMDIDWWGWLSEPAAARCGERALPGTDFLRRHPRQIFNRPIGLVPF